MYCIYLTLHSLSLLSYPSPCFSLYSLFMIFLISIVYQKLLGLMMPHGLNSLMLSLTGKNDSIPDYITCNLE